MTLKIQWITKIFVNQRHEPRAGWRIVMYLGIMVSCGFCLLSLYSSVAEYSGGLARSENAILVNILLIVAGLGSAFAMLRFVDKRPFSALGFGLHSRVWIEVGQGILQSFILVSLIFLAEYGLDCIQLSRSGWNAAEALRSAGYYLALLASAGAFEEIVARGYILQALIQGTGGAAAVTITSLGFGLAHAGNPHASMLGVANTILAGVWLSVAYLKTRSLWLPASLHIAWNMTLGYVYGFPLSGMPLAGAMVKLREHGPVWLTGGEYGPEAGLVVTLAFVAATVYLWRSKHVRPSDNAVALWDADSEDTCV